MPKVSKSNTLSKIKVLDGLSVGGKLRISDKSQLTSILEKIGDAEFEWKMSVYDGAGLIHSLSPRTSKTFL